MKKTKISERARPSSAARGPGKLGVKSPAPVPVKPRLSELLWVQICEAAPNKMFSEAERATVRFLRYNRYVPCAECGRKQRIPWTMVCEFKCADMKAGQFSLQFTGKTHPPLTPVCGSHLLQPAWPDE